MRPLNAPGWFRCYLPPCLGDKRTDDTWQAHYAREHTDRDAKAIRRNGNTDLLPHEDVQGREAFLAERDRRRRLQDTTDHGNVRGSTESRTA